jgi:hypothetical protein
VHYSRNVHHSPSVDCSHRVYCAGARHFTRWPGVRRGRRPSPTANPIGERLLKAAVGRDTILCEGGHAALSGGERDGDVVRGGSPRDLGSGVSRCEQYRLDVERSEYCGSSGDYGCGGGCGDELSAAIASLLSDHGQAFSRPARKPPRRLGSAPWARRGGSPCRRGTARMSRKSEKGFQDDPTFFAVEEDRVTLAAGSCDVVVGP